MSIRKTILILLLFIACIAFVGLSTRVASDLPLIYRENLVADFGLPQTWSTNSNALGNYNLLTLWSWPMSFLYSLGGRLGLSYQVLLGFFGFFLTGFLSIFGISRLLRDMKFALVPTAVGSIIYVLNTYLILLFDGGQVSLALAYSWLPFAYLAFTKALNSNFRSQILAGLSFAVLTVFDIRFLFLLSLVLVIRFFYGLTIGRKESFFMYSFSWIRLSTVILSVLALLNAYWLLPAFLARQPSLPMGYQQAAQTSFLSFVELKHSLLLFQPHWPLNVFGQVKSPSKEFILIPILAVSALFTSKRKKSLFFWVLVAIVGIFLSKGSNPPLGEIYTWLFVSVPGFSLFRDSSKFFILITLAYSILIASVFEKPPSFAKSIQRVVFIAFIIYSIFLIRPVLLGKMTGLLSIPPYLIENQALSNLLSFDREWGRVVWIPRRSNLGFVSPVHQVLEAERLGEARPFAISTVGKYETLNFIRESPFIGQLLDIIGVKYISYPFPDTRAKSLKPDEDKYYHNFSSQIGSLPWVGDKVSDYPVNVFRTESNQERFFLTENIFYIVGSDRIYWDLADIYNFHLSKNTLVFLEERPGMIHGLPDHAKVILFEKNSLDLAASFIAKEDFIFPAESLPREPDSSGWWRRESGDLIWSRDFMQQKYSIDNLDFDFGGGYAIAEGERELRIMNKELGKGEILLARVMSSSRGGKVEFWQGDGLIGEIDTKVENPEKAEVKLTGYKEIPDQTFEYDKAYFKWFEVGELVDSTTLTVKTSGDINVVNSLLSVSRGEWKEAGFKAERLKRDGRVVNWEDNGLSEKEKLFTSYNDAIITYEHLSPTHYKVKISNLNSPSTLVFSETYDPLWTFNGKNSTKVYSLLNGFHVDKDGEFELYFEPQKYVLPGLVISMSTLAVLATYFLYTFISGKKNTRFKPR